MEAERLAGTAGKIPTPQFSSEDELEGSRAMEAKAMSDQTKNPVATTRPSCSGHPARYVATHGGRDLAYEENSQLQYSLVTLLATFL
jgi:hypothetical protein